MMSAVWRVECLLEVQHLELQMQYEDIGTRLG